MARPHREGARAPVHAQHSSPAPLHVRPWPQHLAWHVWRGVACRREAARRAERERIERGDRGGRGGRGGRRGDRDARDADRGGGHHGSKEEKEWVDRCCRLPGGSHQAHGLRHAAALLPADPLSFLMEANHTHCPLPRPPPLNPHTHPPRCALPAAAVSVSWSSFASNTWAQRSRRRRSCAPASASGGFVWHCCWAGTSRRGGCAVLCWMHCSIAPPGGAGDKRTIDTGFLMRPREVSS